MNKSPQQTHLIMKKLANLLKRLSRRARTFGMSPELKETRKRWKKENGPEKRIEYDLNEHSMVFDVGAYKGEWTNAIFARYQSTIHAFEIEKSCADRLQEIYKNNNKIHVHKFGLGTENKIVPLYVGGLGTSIFNRGSGFGKSEGEIKDFAEFAQPIDLLKINIEGGEFELVDYIIKNDWIKDIDNIQICTHDFVPDAEKKLQDMREKLSKTHRCTYQYDWCVENWKRI